MAKTIFSAKNYNSREDLMKEIKSLYGDAPEKKDELSIKGTRLELKRLQLSEGKHIFGVFTICTNCPPKEKGQKKTIQRGKIHKSRLSEGVDVGLNIEKSTE